ncbi:MAG: hypothetical protein GWP67_02815 [Gammaproteobacteria bacterium]|jgi:hypothetical protein|nr:hypothetical protein [Gammaproteobacteria bacterium]
MNEPLEEKEPGAERWVLLRDLGVLQVKLVVDGLRDLVLVPLSLIAGVISLALSKDNLPGPQFYQLLAWGKQSEVWINLFGAVNNSPEKIEQATPFGNQDIDDIVGRLESFVVDEVKRGGVTTQAKERLDKILDAVQRNKSAG